MAVSALIIMSYDHFTLGENSDWLFCVALKQHGAAWYVQTRYRLLKTFSLRNKSLFWLYYITA